MAQPVLGTIEGPGPYGVDLEDPQWEATLSPQGRPRALLDAMAQRPL